MIKSLTSVILSAAVVAATFIVPLNVCAQKKRQAKSTAKSPETTTPKASEGSSSVSIKESFADYTLESFLQFYALGVSEKLYIQTDKPYYSAGEKIWFKGYLVNAVTNQPLTASNFIYVELIDKNDSLITRTKIRADEHGFHNNIELKATLPEGEYVLRGYTQWMRNDGEKSFFRKQLKIVNPIDDAVNSSVSYTKGENNSVTATIALRDQSLAPIVKQRLSCTLDLAGRSKIYNVRTDERGEFKISFSVPAQKGANNTIRITSTDPNLPLKRSIFLPIFSDDFDVQFFPEGGDIVYGQLQSIAFKALGDDGLAREVSGKLFDSDSVLVTEFESEHKGMGRLALVASRGMSYHAELTDKKSGAVKTFTLPAVKSTACAIMVSPRKEKIYYQILHTPDIDPANLGVVIHSRGKPIYADRVGDGKMWRSINSDGMPEGVSEISVIDINSAEPISRRLFFVRHDSCATASLVADKSAYMRREEVTLDIAIKDSQGTPAKGSFAIAVTDRNTVELKPYAENIVSYMMLSSDIKGHIEDPGAYFVNNSTESNAKLDLLMLTQGWTRFDLGDIMTRKLTPRQFPSELTQMVSGEVKGFFGNAARRPTILVFNPASKYFNMFPLGDTNKFTLSDFEYPDSATFIIQAVGRSGSSSSLTLNITEPTFPEVRSHIAGRMLGGDELKLPETFINQSKERYYFEGGMRVIDIEGVSVIHDAEKARPRMYNMTPSRSMSKDQISRFSGMTVLDALSYFPGVTVNSSSQSVSIRGSSVPPLVYVDDMALDIDYLSGISMTDVESLDLVVGSEASIFGMGASAGVILVGFKTGATLASSLPPLPSLAKINHLGYKKPVEYFQPRYDIRDVLTDKTPDLRSTICWDPTIVTDSTGVAKVKFYTADRQSVYDVVIEGITDSGEILRSTAAVRREDF